MRVPDKRAGVWDWEKELCDLIDEAVDRPRKKLEITEEIINLVEDIIFTAYYKGRGLTKGQDR
jgi:hypothetical protein